MPDNKKIPMDQEKIIAGVKLILEGVGEDINREGLRGTPERVARMYAEILRGLHEDPASHLEVLFTEETDEMVLVKDIPFYSVCEHHLVPFFGHAHVAYIPSNGKVTGLSKLARVVESVARRPQLQERMTSTVADVIMKKLNPLGVGVVIEGEHMCMTMRGVNKPGSKTITSAVRGAFKSNHKTREELMSLIHGSLR